MDDDVKNLFQKFGQSTVGYQEIKRESGSELAKQRWPLLRDVRIQAGQMPAEPSPHFLSQAAPRPDVVARPVTPVQSSPVAAQHAVSSAPPFFPAQRAPSQPATGHGTTPAPASLFRTGTDQQALPPSAAQNAYPPPAAVGADQPVSAVFERLAGKPQDSGKTSGSAGGSFFKKMFKP